MRLLQKAIDAKEWQLSRELMRFLHSIDETGSALRDALEEVGLSTPVVQEEKIEQNGLGDH